jgi:hypothetical protein
MTLDPIRLPSQFDCSLFRLLAFGVRRYAWIATVAILMPQGCATPTAVLNFTAPSTVTAGSPFTITVTATISGQRDTMINSYIIFSSSDPKAILPPQYLYKPGDAGSHTWTDGFTLMTAGKQTVSATIYDAAGIHGSAQIAVSR